MGHLDLARDEPVRSTFGPHLGSLFPTKQAVIPFKIKIECRKSDKYNRPTPNHNFDRETHMLKSLRTLNSGDR